VGKGAAVLRWENVEEWPSTLDELHHQLEPGLNTGRSWSRQSPTPLLQFISNAFAVQQHTQNVLPFTLFASMFLPSTGQPLRPLP
jgi:hypothetical protein